MKCPKCKQHIPSKSKFCNKCGEILNTDEIKTKKSAKKSSENKNDDFSTLAFWRQKPSTSTMIVLIISALMLTSLLFIPMHRLYVAGDSSATFFIGMFSRFFYTGLGVVSNVSGMLYLLAATTILAAAFFKLIKKHLLFLISCGANLSLWVLYEMLVVIFWDLSQAPQGFKKSDALAGFFICVICSVSLCIIALAFYLSDCKKAKNKSDA